MNISLFIREAFILRTGEQTMEIDKLQISDTDKIKGVFSGCCDDMVKIYKK